MSQIAPVNHEAKCHLYYAPVDHGPDALVDYDGLDPYWALTSMLINECDGHHELETEISGEQWTLELTYSKSGFAPSYDHDIDSDRLYEIGLNAQGRGQRKCDYNISPRFEDIRHHESGDSITTPFDHTEPDSGISVHAQPSNLRLDEITSLFPRFIFELADDVGVGMYHGYFEAPFDGRITALERYVRILEDSNEKLIGTGGIMDRLSMLLSDAEGTKGEYKWDNEKMEGHNTRVLHGSKGASELCDRHRYGGQLKTYYPKYPENFDEDDPLNHPKFAALFIAGRTATGAVPWEDRYDLVNELDERLLSVLSWSQIPTEPGDTYVSDDHFSADPVADPVPIHADPLPQLEAEQDHLLLTTLRDMTDSDVSIIETVATDGGRDARDLASETELSISTVYRCLDRFDGVLTSDNGHVRFVSQKLRKEVRSVVDSVENKIETAADRVANLVDMDVRQSASSAFGRWLSKWSGEFEAPQSDEDRPVVRIDTVLSEFKRTSQPMLGEAIEEMLDSWSKDGRDVADLMDAIVEVTVDGQIKRGKAKKFR